MIKSPEEGGYLACSTTENWIRFLFSLSRLCAPSANAGIFGRAWLTVAPVKGCLHSREAQEGPSSKGGYYLTRTSPFWFVHVSCVPRVAGIVPGEDLAL